MVELSLDENSVETSVTFKHNESILKYPILDYGITCVNNLTNNPSPKLMDQLMFGLKPIWKLYVPPFL